jgi:hypothetical protein
MNDTITEVIFENKEVGLRATVWTHERGFKVIFRDTDANEPISIIYFPHGRRNDAIAYAERLVTI